MSVLELSFWALPCCFECFLQIFSVITELTIYFSLIFLCPCPVSQDSAGRSTVREQHFTLEDDLTPSFGFVQSFILLTDHYILARVAFVCMTLLNIGVLLAFRFLRVPSGRGELSLNALQVNISS